MRGPRARLRSGLCALLVLSGAATASAQVVLPPDGALLARRHVQFRWKPFAEPVAEYLLQIVADDGSADPFQSGNPIQTWTVDPAEPRAVVTSGLDWGQDYAWRVTGRLSSARVPKDRPIRRFAIADLHPSIPPMTLVIPPGAAPPEPGIVLWSMRRSGEPDSFVLGMDEAGELVLQLVVPDAVAEDLRLLDDGRLLMNTIAPDPISGSCRRAFVTTLDGLVTWASPDTHCHQPIPPPFEKEGVHHEVFPMPEGAPQGANFLMLEYDNRIIPYQGDPSMWWQGDRAVEYDRHTREVVWEWNVFDTISLDDHLPPDHPDHPGPGGDWTHCNALVYVLAQNSVYVSLRRQSRILRLDYDTKQVVYQMGEDSFPSGDVPLNFGDNLFSAQHAPQILPDGRMLLYDNGNYIEPAGDPRVSRALELFVDHEATPPRAYVLWAFRQVLADLVTEAFAPYAGDADRLPGGHTISSDARNASIMECDADGQVVWFLDAGPAWPTDGQGTPGAYVYRVEKVRDLVLDTPGDGDGDWDLDLHDLAELQNAISSAGGGSLGFPERLSDHDGDGDLDADDVRRFAYWMTGPGR